MKFTSMPSGSRLDKVKTENYYIPPPRFALVPLTQRDSQLQQSINALANCPSKLGGRGAKLRRGYANHQLYQPTKLINQPN